MRPSRVLIVGLGGLGCPVGAILAQRGPSASPLSLTLLDDDVVDATNLHRQILYGEADVGALKVERAQARLKQLAADTGTRLEVAVGVERLRPDNARSLIAAHDLVVEGADNLPTKFLAADAAMIEGRTIVHAGVVRWSGWVKAAAPRSAAQARSACLRCVFEDIPRDRVETCAEAGVVGPLVGVIGALQAGLAIRAIEGDATVADAITRVDARLGKVRTSRVRARADCPLCGLGKLISEVSPERYAASCEL